MLIALTTCSECGREVSEFAASCPSCGNPMNAATGAKEAGWHNDPNGKQSHQAYWDGEKWTGETRATPGTTAGNTGLLTALKLMMGAAAAVILGSFLPWASLTAPLVGTVTQSGMEGDGVISAIAGVILLVAAVVAHSKGVVSQALSVLMILISGGIAFIAVTDFRSVQTLLDTSEFTSDGSISTSVGVGLYLIAIGAAVALIASFMVVGTRNKT